MMVFAPTALAAWANSSKPAGSNPGSGHTDAAIASAVSPSPKPNSRNRSWKPPPAMQLVDEATQFVALADDLAQQIVEAALAGPIQDLREGCRQVAVLCQPQPR